MDVPGMIELARPWVSTGFLGVIAFVMVQIVRPAANLWLESKKLDMQARKEDREADRQLEVHRDGLTFQLLETARAEAGHLSEVVQQLRPMAAHALHIKEALDHICALIDSRDDHEKWERVEREAQAFVNRMRRLDEAKGTIRNEAQRTNSAMDAAERSMGGEKA